ncbi:MAG: membrane protein insertion efficiency factor YidD [Candidatus Omnitrophota bacterium]
MLVKIICKLISIYQQTLRMILPVACRFSPSCSQYTKQAILKYGFFKGGLKGLKRITICHPLSGKSGFDPLI